MWMEIQHHSRSKAGDFTWARCGTDSMAKADVWNQTLKQHPLSAEPLPVVSAAQHSQEKGTHPFVLPGTEGKATPERLHRDDQHPVSLSAMECFDQELSGKQNRQENYRQPQKNRWKPIRTNS